ncbi:MAG TPA: hypothetical protein VFF06_16405, partial [Polyangia bacterium]|nr:hypothetical protein [Polyangia bacterium]
LGLWRGGWALLGRAEFLAAGALVAFTLGVRVTSTLESEPSAVTLIFPMFSSPHLLAALIRHHPLFDVGRFAALLLPLSLAGGWSMARAPGVGRGVLALVAGYLVLTLAMGFPEPGVELAFRLPVSTLGLILAAAGAERLWRLGWAARGGVAIAAVAVPLLLPGARVLREVSPLTVEYEWVQHAARELPAKIRLLDVRLATGAPTYHLSSFAFADGQVAGRIDAGATAITLGELEHAPIYFLAGVQCRAWSVIELAGVGEGGRPPTSLPLLRELYAAPLERRIFHDVRAPDTIRPECRRVLDHAVPAGPRGEIPAPLDENPFVLYGGAPISLGFVRLTSPLE